MFHKSDADQTAGQTTDLARRQKGSANSGESVSGDWKRSSGGLNIFFFVSYRRESVLLLFQDKQLEGSVRF